MEKTAILKNDKQILRELYQRRRGLLNYDEVNTKSKLVFNNFTENLLPKIDNFAAKKLAFYFPANNEVDSLVIAHFCQEKYRNILCLPRIIEHDSVLSFKKYQIGDELVENILYSKILEPKFESEEIDPDIVFVPLVAFDRNNNRIGMGGGFYDSLIRRFRENDRKLIFIGLAYDFQFCHPFKINNFDEKLDIIVSESLLQIHGSIR